VSLMAAAILLLHRPGEPLGWTDGLILTAVNLVATVIFLMILDRDRVISGTAPARAAYGDGALPQGITVTRRPVRASTAREEPRWQ
jgi:hypothetical protein